MNKVWKIRLMGYASTVVLATMLAFAILTLGGCAAFGMYGQARELSPEQLRALAADRNANALCLVAPSPWGPVKTVVLSLDKSAIASGAVSSEQNCDRVTIQAEPKVPAAPAKEPTK